LGRDSDLKPIEEAWALTLSGAPQVLAIVGDSGIGKTRLIQEFYRSLTTRYDPEHYWPDVLPDLEKTMTIIPTLGSSVGKLTALPWLWLAVRCRDPGERNRDARGEVAFDAVRRQLQLHLAAFYAARSRRSANRALLRALVGGVASFALPGSGSLVQALNTALQGTGGALGAQEAISALWNRFQAGGEVADVGEHVLQQERQSLVEMAAQAFRAMCDPELHEHRSVPILLVVDDAQWADPLSIEVVERLCEDASRRSWRLLVVIVATSAPALSAQQAPPSLERLLGSAPGAAERGISVQRYELRALSAATLAQIVAHRLPRVGRQAAAVLAKRCSGDIDLLNDFVAELEGAPPWLKDDGTLAVDVRELESLPSKASDMARRRLRTLARACAEALTWAAAQGMQFDEIFVAAIRDAIAKDTAVHEPLHASDETYGITSTHPHRILELSGEFRRHVFWEVCAQWFVRSPHRAAALNALANRIASLFVSGHWSRLDVAERSRLGQRLLDVMDDSEGIEGDAAGWRTLRVSLLSRLARDRLRAGDAHGAAHLCARLLTESDATAEDRRSAWLASVQSAYMRGDPVDEQRLLEAWGADGAATGPELHLSQANFAMRQSRPNEAIAKARLAIADSAKGSASVGVESATTLAHALWTAGRPLEARDALLETERQFSAEIAASAEMQLAVHHTAALFLHDLECNVQVVHRARACIETYRSLGDRQSELISRVNLGDALWGVGRTADAARVLNETYEAARESNLPHAQDIAAICLANVRASAGDLDTALSLYREGIELAQRIGHDWDALYGEVYLALAMAERGEEACATNLWTLSDRASSAGYHYIAALANAFAPLAAKASGAPIEQALTKSRERAGEDAFPGPRAHRAACEVLYARRPEAFPELLSVLGRCEGLKGRRGVVLEALASVEHEATLGAVVREFVQRWRGRFGAGRDSRRSEAAVRLKSCDYRACEARCCYDGVYLDEDEVQRIRKVVKENPREFEHVPQEFIVEGTWFGEPAPKTAIRPHRYVSPDFPSHFTQTRCVFALDDGACSLQDFAVRRGLEPWTWKPRGCWMHPLGIERGRVVPPAPLDEPDTSFQGVAYPGYASFTPCGQDRDDGADWRSLLQAEIEHAREVWKADDEGSDP
jgi:tetratricopeptide (TPR) repeat protein